MSDEERAGAADQLPAADSEVAHEARQVVREIIRREQRRMWLLAGLSIFFWLLAVAGLILLLVGLDRLVISIRIADFMGAGPAPSAPRGLEPAWDLARYNVIHGTSLLHHSIPLIGGSLLALLLASFCTVVLAFSSRRASLQQIQLSLMMLSEQLKELRQTSAAGPAEDADAGEVARHRTAK